MFSEQLQAMLLDTGKPRRAGIRLVYLTDDMTQFRPAKLANPVRS